MNDELKHIRNEYSKYELSEENLIKHPVAQFATWLNDAISLKVREANAMHLATIGKDQKPNGRIVLLRAFDEGGLVFYSNYKSRKGEELDLRPYVSVNFFWPELERQVRIKGKAEKLSSNESDEYFRSRPRESQLGAWASPQSEVIESREYLLNRYKEMSDHFTNSTVPRPEFWGGYRLSPDYFEFWQGGTFRLHDRFEFIKQGEGNWKINRLAP